MAVVIRLEQRRPGHLDAELALIGPARLTRCASGTYIDLDGGDTADAIRGLARAGIAVGRGERPVARSPGLLPAIARHLRPVDAVEGVCDELAVRPVSLAEASSVLCRGRGWLGRSSPTDREQCRALLRGEDSVLAWRRVVWCRPQILRSLTASAQLRPVVFDRFAVERPPSQWAYASQGAIARWAFP